MKYESPQWLFWVLLSLGFVIAIALTYHELRMQKLNEGKSGEHKIDSVIHELESTTVILNGTQVSIGQIFVEFSDWFTRGLPETAVPQLLSSRFGEKEPTVWSTVQTVFIKMLYEKQLIEDYQKQTTVRGTETHYKPTKLGCEILDELEKQKKARTKPPVSHKGSSQT